MPSPPRCKPAPPDPRRAAELLPEIRSCLDDMSELTLWLAEHVETTRRVRAALGPDILIIQTLFSPLTVASLK